MCHSIRIVYTVCAHKVFKIAECNTSRARRRSPYDRMARCRNVGFGSNSRSSVSSSSSNGSSSSSSGHGICALPAGTQLVIGWCEECIGWFDPLNICLEPLVRNFWAFKAALRADVPLEAAIIDPAILFSTEVADRYAPPYHARPPQLQSHQHHRLYSEDTSPPTWEERAMAASLGLFDAWEVQRRPCNRRAICDDCAAEILSARTDPGRWIRGIRQATLEWASATARAGGLDVREEVAFAQMLFESEPIQEYFRNRRATRKIETGKHPDVERSQVLADQLIVIEDRSKFLRRLGKTDRRRKQPQQQHQHNQRKTKTVSTIASASAAVVAAAAARACPVTRTSLNGNTVNRQRGIFLTVDTGLAQKYASHQQLHTPAQVHPRRAIMYSQSPPPPFCADDVEEFVVREWNRNLVVFGIAGSRIDSDDSPVEQHLISPRTIAIMSEQDYSELLSPVVAVKSPAEREQERLVQEIEDLLDNTPSPSPLQTSSPFKKPRYAPVPDPRRALKEVHSFPFLVGAADGDLRVASPTSARGLGGGVVKSSSRRGGRLCRQKEHAPPRPGCSSTPSRPEKCPIHNGVKQQGCVDCTQDLVREHAIPPGRMCVSAPVSPAGETGELVSAVQALCFCHLGGIENCMTCSAREESKKLGIDWF